MAGFAVLDFEITGFAAHDRVAEVGVVLLSTEGDIEGEWSTLLNPGRATSAQLTSMGSPRAMWFVHPLRRDCSEVYRLALPGTANRRVLKWVNGHLPGRPRCAQSR